MSLFNWLIRRRQRERELGEEVESHLRMAEQERREQGEPADRARASAAREFGNVGLVKEVTREMWGRTWLADLPRDVRIGVRMLLGNPGFSLLVILCLTLGIGANAIVFSWIEGIMFRPYPLVRHQERMAAMAGTLPDPPGRDDVSWPDFLDLERNSKLADAFVSEKISGARLGLGDRAEYVQGSVVSANYFDALGVHPILGRGFEPGENLGRNAHPVTVISYQMWQRRFGGDPAVIGKTQMLNGVQHMIVGIAPEGFYGTFVGYQFQFWVPVSMQETFEPGGYKLEDRGARWIEGFVMLKPGVSIQTAQQEISGIASRLETAYPGTNRGRGIRLFPLWQTPFNGAGALGPTLGMALLVVILVLVIASANVTNLMLVRSLARRREMTVRVALGAGRGRLVRQLLTEGLILSSLAVASALVAALWSRDLLPRLASSRGYLPGELDLRVFAMIVAVGLFASLPFALAPALESRKLNIADALKAESSGVVGGRGKAWVRSALVVAQVSLSFLLLVGAGLVLKSLVRMRTSSPGFSTENVMTTYVNLSAAGYDTQRAKSFQDELLSRVKALPGVEFSAYARVEPFTFPDYSSAPITVEGYEVAPGQQPTASYDEVSPGYFSTMGIPLLSGREFTLADDEKTAPVAIVNEAMVEQYWRGEDPVGKRLQARGQWLSIVGVARLAKYRNFLEPSQPFFYVPLRQYFSSEVVLNIRTSMPVQTMAPALARALHSLDAELPVYGILTMREQVDRMSSPQRVAVTLLIVFGGLALLLAAVGLYGVMSYAVSLSTRELGLRMAMGARPADLLRLILSRGLVLAAVGVALGGAAAVASTRLLGYLLYQVTPRDPAAFSAAFAVMTLVSLAACFVPSWRATRINPVQALQG